MRQRLGIAQALLNTPKLLICDEPTSALDPQGRTDFLQLLASLRGQTTILFSTHILSDVERICDHVGILHHGRLQVSAPLDDLKQQYAKNQIALSFATTAQAQQATHLLATLQQQGQLTHLEQQKTVFKQHIPVPMLPLLIASSPCCLKPNSFRSRLPSKKPIWNRSSWR